MDLTNIRLNDVFSLQGKNWLVLLLITFSLDLYAGEQHPREYQHSVTQDSLLIERFNGKRAHIVKEGRLIKIWVGEEKIRGEFLGRKGDSLSIKEINTEGTILKYHVNDISKIKIFGNLVRNIIGWPIKIWGGAIVVAGFAPLFDWGPAGFLITIPAWIVGTGIYLIGVFISGTRVFNLEKNWHIK
ncbi:MAG: hypothetical protein AB8H47_27030 [Bacteroidia bacterium]